MPYGYSKATGIQYVLNHYHLNLSDAYALGDSNNDLPMLSYVSHSIAMGNASPESLLRRWSMSLPSQAAAESGRRWNIITSYKACLPLCGDVICFASFYGGKGFGGSYENFSTNTLRFDSGGAFNRLWHCRGNRAHTSAAIPPSDLGTSDSEAVQESELTLDSASDSASEMLYDYERLKPVQMAASMP